MRHLLVVLFVFAFLLQMIPAYSGEKKCQNKLGTCRKQCKEGEAVKEVCTNHRICCISARKIRIPEPSDEPLPKTTTTAWYDLPTGAMDVILTIPATNYFEENFYD
ncbi:PREDICTED: beta-defensin 118 [Chinchilla lanigera]|uniref:beta-defensin 118 n=1 Tax=Chinchilla lanigera TaxID=34839 RepID=UPI00038EEB16|nr:PREDICTED: beta-defensin 118 [Chinchilla lanigera]